MKSTPTLGILIQGKVSEWTKDIIHEYRENFPNAEIVFSTWKGENLENIECKIIQSELPSVPESHPNTVNYQIVGCQEGLKNIHSDVVMKCRSDQFIHNKSIFEMFFQSCPPEKIMVPELGTASKIIEHRTSDFCQIAYREILLNYWNNIPLYTGIPWEESAKYMTKHYVLNTKNDNDPWKLTLKKYFFVKRFHEDFQIEWEKLNLFDNYKETYDLSYPNSATIDN